MASSIHCKTSFQAVAILLLSAIVLTGRAPAQSVDESPFLAPQTGQLQIIGGPTLLPGDLTPITPGAAVLPKSPAGATIAPHERAPLTTAVRSVAAANNAFGIDLFGQLRASGSGSENRLLSPLSISTALAMTYAGARGHNAEQMASVLHLDGLSGDSHAGYGALMTDLNAPCEGYDLSVVNRLFGQQGFDFRESYLDRLVTDYQAPMERLDFYNSPDPSRKHINTWVEDQTNQRIKDLLPDGSVTARTRLVLTNAVYFNGQWKHEFKEEATQDASFYRADGTMAATPTMYQRNVFKYGVFGDFQMVELPYAGDDLSMVVILPNESDGLATVENALTNESLDASLAALELRTIDVHLPKFTFKDEAKLKSPLLALGMTDAFNGGDFTGISDVGLQIDEVYHKTFIDVNESGTEAAAATAVVMVATTSTWTPPPPVFRADHPFLFALRDTHSGSLLFLGRMADPGAATAAANVPEPGSAAMALGALLVMHRVRRRRR